MGNRDTNDRIALMMGWAFVPYRSVQGMALPEWLSPQLSKTFENRPNSFAKLGNVKAGIPVTFSPPEYTTDPAAALEAAGKLARDRCIEWIIKFNSVKNLWAVTGMRQVNENMSTSVAPGGVWDTLQAAITSVIIAVLDAAQQPTVGRDGE